MRQPVIRLATESDIEPMADLHVRAWQAAYRGHMPDQFLDALQPASRARVWTQALGDSDCVVLVADSGAELLGFCSLLPTRDRDAEPATAELVTIYVEPRCLRMGIGSLLLEHVVNAARARDFRALSLWVIHDNLPALAFYQARGFIPDGASKTQSVTSFEVRERRLRRTLVSAPEAPKE